jgi:hypothetical protein
MAKKDVRLTKFQRNDVFKAVNESGLSPQMFEWDEAEHLEIVNVYQGSVLRHIATGFWFYFGYGWVRYTPAKVRVAEMQAEPLKPWKDKLRELLDWLHRVRDEITTPDLWATIGQEKALSTAASSAIDNRPFNAAEQSLIATKLDDIKAYLLEGQEFAAEQAGAVDREFAYLKESSKRLGRKDWLNILLGGLFGLAVTLALEPEKARGLLRLAGTVFQSLWGMAQGLLP